MKALEVLQNNFLPDKILIFSKNIPESQQEKVDHMALIINMIDGEISDLKKKENELKAKIKNYELIIESAKSQLKEEMFTEGLCEIQGKLIKFCIQNSNPKLIIENENDLPEKYKFDVITTNIDKEKLKNDLKSGLEIIGAKLEVGQTLRIGAVK